MGFIPQKRRIADAMFVRHKISSTSTSIPKPAPSPLRPECNLSAHGTGAYRRPLAVVIVEVLLLFLHGIFRLKAPPESRVAVKLQHLGQCKRSGDLQPYFVLAVAALHTANQTSVTARTVLLLHLCSTNLDGFISWLQNRQDSSPCLPPDKETRCCKLSMSLLAALTSFVLQKAILDGTPPPRCCSLC